METLSNPSSFPTLTLWFPLILALIVLWFITDDNDDNDEPGGGLMQPVYNPN